MEKGRSDCTKLCRHAKKIACPKEVAQSSQYPEVNTSLYYRLSSKHAILARLLQLVGQQIARRHQESRAPEHTEQHDFMTGSQLHIAPNVSGSNLYFAFLFSCRVESSLRFDEAAVLVACLGCGAFCGRPGMGTLVSACAR